MKEVTSNKKISSSKIEKLWKLLTTLCVSVTL